MASLLRRYAGALVLVCGGSLLHAAPPPPPEDGVTATSVTIGQSAAFSGPASDLGNDYRNGALAYFEYVNGQGGVHGRKIVLKSLDDGYEPSRTVTNTKKFVDEERVFALFGYVGTPTSLAAKPYFVSGKLPFFGAFTGADALRNPPNRYVFNVRASYEAEMQAMVAQLARVGISRIAVFYQNDAYGQAGLDAAEKAFAKNKLKAVAYGAVERNTTEVAKAVATIAKADPQAVLMVSAYKSCAVFIREMQKAGANPQFLNLSFVGARSLATELGEAGRGVVVAQVVPFPWNVGSTVVKEYQRIFGAYNGKPEFSFTSLEGFIAAKLFVEGLRRAGPGPKLTRENFIAALESAGTLDLGGFSVSFGPDDRGGSRFVELTIITKNGGFMR
ncbi:Leu/Ile/Val-binding protein [Burkholderiales bacterium]|nr:Leu/Ile/Val-binding protein [Burkholderiales bacterium]